MISLRKTVIFFRGNVDLTKEHVDFYPGKRGFDKKKRIHTHTHTDVKRIHWVESSQNKIKNNENYICYTIVRIFNIGLKNL